VFWAVERRGRGARALETDDSRAFLAQIASAQTVHAKVRWALKNLGFETLTEIQAAAVPAAAENSDVVIAAETGSGKTLSYLIPIWSNLLERGVGGRDDDDGSRETGALILCPNATLCEQVARVANSLVDEGTGEPLLRTYALMPETGTPFHAPDVYVTTPARAVDDLLRFREGAWRRGSFSPTARTLRHVVFDEADMLFSGGYLKPLRMCFDVLYREEKLASEGFYLPGTGNEDAAAEWDGDVDRDASSFERDWRKDHDGPRKRGPALGGKGKVGLGDGRDFRRQYIFAAATVMSNGKKTPGAMIKYGFPDAKWIEGRRLHRSVESVNQTWVEATLETRAMALADAVGLTSAGASAEKTMIFVNTAAAADEIAREFNALGLRAAAFHADMASHERAMRLKDFADGVITALVCTDSAARGVDIPGVTHVVQAEFAGNAVDYLHRIGRTARAGATGRVTNICLPGSADLVRAVRDAEANGDPVESAFSRKRSFRKKTKKYGPSRKGVADLSLRRARDQRS